MMRLRHSLYDIIVFHFFVSLCVIVTYKKGADFCQQKRIKLVKENKTKTLPICIIKLIL